MSIYFQDYKQITEFFVIFILNFNVKIFYIFQNHKPKITFSDFHYKILYSIYVQDYKPKCRFTVIFILGHHLLWMF